MHRTRLATRRATRRAVAHPARLLTAALVLTSALVAATPTGHAAARRVGPQDVPSKADVVRALPGLAGVSTGKFADDTISHYAGLCSTWEWAQGRSGQVLSGEDLATARGVRATVVQFRSKARARAVFRTFRAFVRDCGQHWAGVDTTVHRVRMPGLGDQRIGYRTTETFAPHKSLPTRHHLTVAVRKGTRLLVLTVQQPEPTRKARFVRLARVAAAKMG